MNETIKNYCKIIISTILIIFVGYQFYSMHNSLAEANEKITELTSMNGKLVDDLAKAKNDYMELKSNQKTETVIQYVEKETPNDGDFQIDKKPPKVVINAGDGLSYEYTPDTKSFQSIKDGKVVVSEDNTLTLDIEKITDARFKDRVDALNAQHALDIDEKNKEIDNLNRKLKVVRRQRDFYGGVVGIGAFTGIGVGISKSF